MAEEAQSVQNSTQRPLGGRWHTLATIGLGAVGLLGAHLIDGRKQAVQHVYDQLRTHYAGEDEQMQRPEQIALLQGLGYEGDLSEAGRIYLTPSAQGLLFRQRAMASNQRIATLDELQAHLDDIL